jgi:hypothetical protein
MVQIIEDVITGSETPLGLEFQSEYQFLTKKSLVDVRYTMLVKGKSIVEEIVK